MTSAETKSPPPAITVRGLRKTFKVGFSGLKTVEALRGVDLTVERGEIYGFLGPNGAGKSTTIKVLTRLIGASAGEALVFGEALDNPAARRRVGYLPENPVFYDYLTGMEFLLYYAALLDIPRAAAKKQAESLLEQVGIPGAARLQLRRYSKGMTQRIGIAQALLGDPELVILDEPVSGLDPIGRREMRELILGLKERGKTVFFSTHIIPDVEMICDRVGIIIAGRMVREGTVGALLSEAESRTHVILERIPPDRANELFPGRGVREIGGQTAVEAAGEEEVNAVLRLALDAGIRVVSIQTDRRALEDLFIDQIEATGAESDSPRASVRRAGGES